MLGCFQGVSAIFLSLAYFVSGWNWGELLNFLNLEYFIALIYAGNISRAAAQLYVSQQTLSENLSKLERELGTTLFLRGRQIILTEAGERFFSFARTVLNERDSMRTDMSKIADTSTQIIRCGIYAFEFPPIISRLLIHFLETAPKSEIKFTSYRDVYPDNPERTNVDIVISDVELDGSRPFSDALWNCENIYCSEDYAIIVHRSLMEKTYGSRLPAVEERLQRERSLAAIVELPLLAAESNRNLHYRMMAQAFEVSGLTPNIIIKTDANSLINTLCAAGAGAYFGPRGLCKSKVHDLLMTEDLKCYDIHVPALYNGLIACWPKAKKLTETQRKLIAMMKDFVSEVG